MEKYPPLARGARKVTTGIIGFWQPGVHSDAAFGSFDFGTFYHCEVEFTKHYNCSTSNRECLLGLDHHYLVYC